MVKVVTLALCLTMAGCASGGSFCLIESPRRPSQSEIATMSDRAIEADLAHNIKGEQLCGWKK